MNRELLKRHCEAICKKFKDVPTSGTYEEHRFVLDLLEQTEWIPVSKRLPKDEQEVLITYKINVKHHVWSGIWDELHCRFYDKKYRNYMSVDSVIAWMPLPEPYKAESEEQTE